MLISIKLSILLELPLKISLFDILEFSPKLLNLFVTIVNEIKTAILSDIVGTLLVKC